jgi:hypothetical protein
VSYYDSITVAGNPEAFQAPVEPHRFGSAGYLVSPSKETVREVGRRSPEIVEGGEGQVLALDLELGGDQDLLQRRHDVPPREAVPRFEDPDQLAEDDAADEKAPASCSRPSILLSCLNVHAIAASTGASETEKTPEIPAD